MTMVDEWPRQLGISRSCREVHNALTRGSPIKHSRGGTNGASLVQFFFLKVPRDIKGIGDYSFGNTMFYDYSYK